MSNSTPSIDDDGIRRGQSQQPKRHLVDAGCLEFLRILANLGEPGSIERQGWDILLQVHGFQAVVQATARCFHQVDYSGKVSNDQAQAVLDGKLPCGHAIVRHTQARRRIVG